MMKRKLLKLKFLSLKVNYYFNIVIIELNKKEINERKTKEDKKKAAKKNK